MKTIYRKQSRAKELARKAAIRGADTRKVHEVLALIERFTFLADNENTNDKHFEED